MANLTEWDGSERAGCRRIDMICGVCRMVRLSTHICRLGDDLHERMAFSSSGFSKTRTSDTLNEGD